MNPESVEGFAFIWKFPLFILFVMICPLGHKINTQKSFGDSFTEQLFNIGALSIRQSYLLFPNILYFHEYQRKASEKYHSQHEIQSKCYTNYQIMPNRRLSCQKSSPIVKCKWRPENRLRIPSFRIKHRKRRAAYDLRRKSRKTNVDNAKWGISGLPAAFIPHNWPASPGDAFCKLRQLCQFGRLR